MKSTFTKIACLFLLVGNSITTTAQDINVLVQNVKKKIEKVNDYEAEGTMKTNVAFLKIPIAKIKLYFKRPNLLKLKSEQGVSFMPKGAMSLNLNHLFANQQYVIIDGGNEKINNQLVRVAKLLPNDDNSEMVLSTIYIDPANEVIVKSKTTTKENGTYELNMYYGKYIGFGLPDKILFSFNAKDYKLPKGITFDFDDGSSQKAKTPIAKNKKGQAEIYIKRYLINKGLSEKNFQ